MGFDTAIFVQQPVDENLVCSICCGVFEKPTIACSNIHTFCEDCIKIWGGKGRGCPGCRSPMDGTNKPLNRPLESITMALQVRCLEKKGDEQNKENAPSTGRRALRSNKDETSLPTACQWSGLLSDFVEKHKCKECEFTVAPCSLCQKTMGVTDLEAHQKNDCLGRKVPCNLCHAKLAVRNLENHKADYCPERSVSCEHCGELVPLKKLGTTCVDFDKPQLVTFTGHMRKCSKLHIPCDFAGHGCTLKMRREKMPDHLMSAMGAHMSLLSADMQKGWTKVGLVWVFSEHLLDKLITQKVVRSKTATHGSFESLVSLIYDGQFPEHVQVKISVLGQQYRPTIERVSIQVEASARTFESVMLPGQLMTADGAFRKALVCSTIHNLVEKATSDDDGGMPLTIDELSELLEAENSVKISVSFRLCQPERVVVGSDV